MFNLKLDAGSPVTGMIWARLTTGAVGSRGLDLGVLRVSHSHSHSLLLTRFKERRGALVRQIYVKFGKLTWPIWSLNAPFQTFSLSWLDWHWSKAPMGRPERSGRRLGRILQLGKMFLSVLQLWARASWLFWRSCE